MKCPKCHYLGFETGDRCRNCGYDFSLITAATADPDADEGEAVRSARPQPGEFDLDLRTSRREEAPAPELPLFNRGSGPDDEPLIKLPVTPRPPLAVRRAPETPRLHMVPKSPRRVEVEPALQFDDAARNVADSRPAPAAVVAVSEDADQSEPAAWAPRERHAEVAQADAPASKMPPPQIRVTASSPVSRAAAAVIDFALLGAVDVAVVYFTLRVAGLGMNEWNVLPVAPLAVFLILLKLAYFSAFTAVGGQTIGKMALHIRVVTDGLMQPDAGVALRRTLIGAASGACLGFGFVPAFFDPEGRAFHDRITRTRVVTFRTA